MDPESHIEPHWEVAEYISSCYMLYKKMPSTSVFHIVSSYDHFFIIGFGPKEWSKDKEKSCKECVQKSCVYSMIVL